MKACNIYKTKDYYKIITQSETEDGFWLSVEPVFIISVSDSVESLKKVIFEALKSSKNKIPTPKREEYPILQMGIMKKLKEKSYTSLYKQSNSCDLRLENGNLKVYPETFLNPSKPTDGLVWVQSDMVEILDAENKKDEVTQKVIDILNRNYR